MIKSGRGRQGDLRGRLIDSLRHPPDAPRHSTHVTCRSTRIRDRPRGHDRAAQARSRLQAAQLSRLAAVGARADGRARRRADPVVEQLPRSLRRAVGDRRRGSTASSSSAPARRACASSAARSRFTASSRRRSRDSSDCESSLSFVSAWNANEGLTATVAQEGDFVVSDALNHASIIDSMRLAKAITQVHDGRVQARRHGRPARQARRGEGRQATNDLDGRNLLDGGRDREAAGHSRRSRATRLRSSSSTTRTRPACSARTDEERPSTSACSARSTSSRRRSARRSAARRADSSPDRKR